jgi:hypothetical protein
VAFDCASTTAIVSSVFPDLKCVQHVSTIDLLFRQKSWWLANLGFGLGCDWHPTSSFETRSFGFPAAYAPLVSESAPHKATGVGVWVFSGYGSTPNPWVLHLTVNLKRVEALPRFLTSSRHDAELILRFSIALLINLIVGPLISRVALLFHPTFHIFRKATT